MQRWAGRLFVFTVGALAVTWTSYTLPVIVVHAPVERLAKRIAARETFRIGPSSDSEVTTKLLGDSKWIRPSIQPSQAMLAISRLERLTSVSNSGKIDEAFLQTEASIQRALSAAPSDAFLWAVYFWVENSRLGFNPAHLNYLDMSYETGPHEGWIALTRSRFSLALFGTLPSELADKTVREFRGLVASGFFDVAVDRLSQRTEAVTSRLLASLAGVELDMRESFAKAAYRKGFEWKVPGVDRPEWRPWN